MQVGLVAAAASSFIIGSSVVGAVSYTNSSSIAAVSLSNSLDGSDVSVGTANSFLVSADIKALEKGSTVWLTYPDSFETVDASAISFDHGTVSVDGHNVSVVIDKVSSSVAPLDFSVSLDSSYVSTLTTGDKTFIFDTSSGNFKDTIDFEAYPTNKPSVASSLSPDGKTITFNYVVPSKIYTDRVAFLSTAGDGYKIQSLELHALSDSLSSVGTTVTFDDDSTDEEAFGVFSGAFPSGATSLRWVVTASVTDTSLESFTNVMIASFPAGTKVSKRDVNVAVTVSVNKTGTAAAPVTSVNSSAAPLSAPASSSSSSAAAGTSAATVAVSTTASGSESATSTASGSESATSTASGSASGSVSGSASASTSATTTGSESATSTSTTTVEDISTTVVTVCTKCEHPETTVGYSIFTTTESGVVTEYTTYCPLTASKATTTVSSVVTEYTTYCPETTVHTVVIGGTTYTGEVVVSSVSDDIYTVYTSYEPVSPSTVITSVTAESYTTLTTYITVGAESTAAPGSGAETTEGSGSGSGAETTEGSGSGSGAEATESSGSGSGAEATESSGSGSGAEATESSGSGIETEAPSSATETESSESTLISVDSDNGAVRAGVSVGGVLALAAFLL